MTNKTLAKVVMATGAGVVVVTLGAPLIVRSPTCPCGWRVSRLEYLNKDDDKKKDDDKEE